VSCAAPQAPAPQAYQAAPAPQTYQAAPAPQSSHAAPTLQTYQAAPAPQQYQAAQQPVQYAAAPQQQQHYAPAAPTYAQQPQQPQQGGHLFFLEAHSALCISTAQHGCGSSFDLHVCAGRSCTVPASAGGPAAAADGRPGGSASGCAAVWLRPAVLRAGRAQAAWAGAAWLGLGAEVR